MRISDWSSDVCSSDLMLLEGRGIDFKNVRSFARWLETVILPSQGGDQISRYVTKVLHSCSAFVLWFVENFTPFVSYQVDSNVNYVKLIECNKQVWSEVMAGGNADAIAKDRSEERRVGKEGVST